MDKHTIHAELRAIRHLMVEADQRLTELHSRLVEVHLADSKHSALGTCSESCWYWGMLAILDRVAGGEVQLKYYDGS